MCSIIIPEMKAVAICANKRHTCIDPNSVGSMLRTKINVNLGGARDCKDYDIAPGYDHIPSAIGSALQPLPAQHFFAM